jgi:predicted nuclease of predicted toxin-antitoxin system
VAPKLLLDEHLSTSIAHRLSACGFDVSCVRDRGLLGLDDWELLDWCASDGRAICTENERHFKRQHELYLAAGKDHYGVITVEEWPTEKLFHALQAFRGHTEDIDLLNRFAALSEPQPRARGGGWSRR